ncbi:MAG: starch synthase, partial [Methylococcaceae bacterium]|nr:starch synthase [Methylococcaceae bacterium]
MNKILFASSEVHPLIKTGGLADVAGSLPIALAELGQDIRIIMPRYDAIKLTEPVIEVSRLRVNNCDVVIQETQLPDSSVKVWLVDYPEYFGKPGNPYVDQNGEAWPDSAEKFALFCRISTEVATNRAGLDWKADLVHCNDWQTGLIPALLSLESNPPASIFTIHNMAYQGLFDSSTFSDLNLPGKLWKPSALEYFGQLS